MFFKDLFTSLDGEFIPKNQFNLTIETFSWHWVN